MGQGVPLSQINGIKMCPSPPQPSLILYLCLYNITIDSPCT